MAMTPEFQAFMKENFSLDNYAGASELDLQGWYNQLKKRSYFLYDVEEGELYWPLEELLIDPLAEGREFPLYKNHVAIRNWNKLDYFLTNRCVAILPDEYKPLNDKLVELDSKMRADEDISPEVKFMRRGVLLRTEGYDIGQTDLLENTTPPSLHEFVDVGCSDLKVDMYFSDKELITAFGEWLSAERSRLTEELNQSYTKRSFHNSDVETWVRFKVLEYLDLKIAAKYLNSPLNDNEIAWFLLNDLPPGVNPLSRLRTVKKHAEKMIRWSSIQALEIQTRTST
jgi:hypothetical protein